MNLIESIEIGYFRSIYKEKLDKLADLNVIFGRNDSGKSNFLRALNLFFKGETNPDVVIDFDRDFSHARQHEVSSRTDARKFIYVKIVFNTPQNWQKALGKSFYVKKSWSVSRGTEYKLDSSIDKPKQQFLTRFLNKIEFHFIPAIKDRRIFESLLAKVYNVISEHEEFRNSLQSFTTELQGKTVEISDDLALKLGITSAIAPPTDLTDLFRSLDFETGNSYGGKHSLTLQRGDGMQVRHIPPILGFLSDKGPHDFNIWGFEEPENSLELANAVKEAEALLGFAKASNKQIFVTSHSPAFFSIDDDRSRRFFVSKQIKPSLGAESSYVEAIGSGIFPSQLMGETPLLPVISCYLTQASREIEQLKEDGQSLRGLLSQTTRPMVFVEGDADKIVLGKAWRVLRTDACPFEIESCHGTTKMKSLSQDGNVLKLLNPERSVFVLVDNDSEGRELSKSDNKKLGQGGKWVRHKSSNLPESNGSYWCRLPFTADFVSKMNEWNIPPESWPFTLENCFSQEVHNLAVAAGHLKFEEMPHAELLSCNKSKRIAVSKAASDDYTYLRAPHPDYKVPFAEWLVVKSDAEPDLLGPFRVIFEGLVSLLSSNRGSVSLGEVV